MIILFLIRNPHSAIEMINEGKMKEFSVFEVMIYLIFNPQSAIRIPQ